MAAHPIVTDEIIEVASAYALGLLEAPATAKFEKHLLECATCRSEAQAFQEVTGELAYAAPIAEPAPRLKSELLRRLTPPGVLVRADESAWQKTPFPGVELRNLFVDKVTGTVTSLLRAAVGAVYPAHRHGGMEHVYVIDGDLIFNDHTLETGDYEVSPGSTDHSSITTKTGCLALIIHNLDDTVL